jgi:hypothetical protein
LLSLSVETLFTMDTMLGNMTQQARQKMTPRAETFRTLTLDTVVKAATQAGGIDKLINRVPQFDSFGQLVDVTEQLSIPKLPEVNRTALLEILPDKLRRGVKLSRAECTDELLVLREIGILGNDFIRYLIQMLRQTVRMEPFYNHLFKD